MPFQIAFFFLLKSDSLRVELSGDRIPVRARFSAYVQTGSGAQPASCKMGTGSVSQRQSWWRVALTTQFQIVPRLKKEWICTSTSPLGLHGLF
jgi:hypothetical protein